MTTRAEKEQSLMYAYTKVTSHHDEKPTFLSIPQVCEVVSEKFTATEICDILRKNEITDEDINSFFVKLNILR